MKRGDGSEESRGGRGRKHGGRRTQNGGARPARKAAGRARRESSAGGVVYRRGDGVPLFLLIRDRYGQWGFPKGHLERGERAESAALREVMEETGLRSVSVLQSIATIDWRFRFRGALIHKSCHFFLMESASGVTDPQRSEGITECRWTSIDEARDLIAYENARGVLLRANEILAERTGAGRPALPPAIASD